MKRISFTSLLFSLIITNSIAQDVQVPTEQFSFITKKTATWCPICGGAAWDSFRKMIDDNEESAILVAAHYDNGSRLFSQAAQDIVSNFEGGVGYGQPVFFYNNSRLNGRGDATVADVRDRVRNAYSNNPIMQTGIKATVQAESRTLLIETKTTFFSSAEGNFRLGIYPILKEVEEIQASQGNAIHKQILLDEITGESFGKIIASSSTPSGMTINETYEIKDNAIITAATANNLQLAAVLWQENGDTYEFINGYTTDTIEEEMISSNESYDIPNLDWHIRSTGNLATLELDITESLKNVEIVIYTLDGKKISTLYEGDLLKGTHQFQLDGHAGIQVAAIKMGSQINAKTFFIQ